MKQGFEPRPSDADVANAYDLLRYESALQKRRIETLEKRIADLEAELSECRIDRDLAQGVVDRLTARLVGEGLDR